MPVMITDIHFFSLFFPSPLVLHLPLFSPSLLITPLSPFLLVPDGYTPLGLKAMTWFPCALLLIRLCLSMTHAVRLTPPIS